MSDKEKDSLTTEEARNMFTAFGAKINKLLNPSKPKAIMLTAATGEIIDFPEVMEGETPAVEDVANIEGVPADGEFTMADGTVYVFAGGKVVEVRPVEAEEPEELAALKEQVTQLQTQLADKTAALDTATERNTTLEEGLKTVKEDLSQFKALTGDFSFEGTKDRKEEKEGAGKPKLRTSGMKERIAASRVK